MLARLKSEYEAKGVHFISLTIEPDDDEAAVQSWLKKAGAESLPVGRASDAIMEKLIRMGGAQPGAIPANVFITADGHITRSMVGPSAADLASAVSEITSGR